MTRAQVVAKLGKPESESQNGVLSYKHRPVETQFLVDRFGRKRARVLDVFILFTDRGP